MKLRSLVVAFGLLAASPFGAQAQLIDAVAAVVGHEVILLSELYNNDGIREAIRNLRETTSPEEFETRANALLLEALEESIETKILFREAQRASISLDDKYIEDRMNKIRDNFDTNEEFLNELTEMGLTLSELRERERKFRMAQTMYARKLRDLETTIVISESDVTNYYEDHKKDYVIPEQVRTRQIMIRSRRGSDERKESIALLNSIREKIREGTDFGEMAREHSDLMGAENGGIVGWQTRGEQLQILDDAAFALESGQMSEVLESRLGVHLILVDEHTQAGGLELKEAWLQIEPGLRRQMAAKQYEKWINDLRSHSNVRILLDVY